jgi:hypothetical protein
MTVHKLRLLTNRESEERTRRLARVFDELENQVCEFRHMSTLALKSLHDRDAELRDWTVTKLCAMAQALWKGYYEICNSADPRVKPRAIA